MVFTEFLVGAGMGIATNVVFEAAQLTGQVLGIQMGYSLVNILDPQTPGGYHGRRRCSTRASSCCCFCAWTCITGCCAPWATAFSMCRRERRT